jgi:hypothetical protein
LFPIREIVPLMLDTVELLAPPIVPPNTVEPALQMVSLPWTRAGWITRVPFLLAESRRIIVIFIIGGALPYRTFPLTPPSERPYRTFPLYPILARVIGLVA